MPNIIVYDDLDIRLRFISTRNPVMAEQETVWEKGTGVQSVGANSAASAVTAMDSMPATGDWLPTVSYLLDFSHLAYYRQFEFAVAVSSAFEKDNDSHLTQLYYMATTLLIMNAGPFIRCILQISPLRLMWGIESDNEPGTFIDWPTRTPSRL
jgi:hypothetical protein